MMKLIKRVARCSIRPGVGLLMLVGSVVVLAGFYRGWMGLDSVLTGLLIGSGLYCASGLMIADLPVTRRVVGRGVIGSSDRSASSGGMLGSMADDVGRWLQSWSGAGRGEAGRGEAGGTGAPGCAIGPTAIATDRDIRYRAAHMVGHTLAYAALWGLPPDLALRVADQPDEAGVLQALAGMNKVDRLDEKTFAEWHMLVLLSGKTGEMVLFGEPSLASGDDHARWLEIARRYLGNHYRGIFYPDPQNRFEQRQNEVKLEALQADQLALLRAFLAMNTDILYELTDLMVDRRVLHRDALMPFLSRVRLPSGFPIPFDACMPESGDFLHALLRDTAR